MKKLFPILAMGILAATAPIKAAPGSAMLEERYKAALSEMVQEVRNTPDPQEKRRILGHFIDHMQEGLGKAESLESLSEQDRSTLHSVTGKFYAYHSELNGQGGYARVADADLNEFAGYIQQGMEQAPAGGGVYISGGALLVILVLLIIFL